MANENKKIFVEDFFLDERKQLPISVEYEKIGPWAKT